LHVLATSTTRSVSWLPLQITKSLENRIFSLARTAHHVFHLWSSYTGAHRCVTRFSSSVELDNSDWTGPDRGNTRLYCNRGRKLAVAYLNRTLEDRPSGFGASASVGTSNVSYLPTDPSVSPSVMASSSNPSWASCRLSVYRASVLTGFGPFHRGVYIASDSGIGQPRMGWVY
jgi:hypothetical protein